MRAGSADRPDWNLIIRVVAGCDYRVSPINQTSPVAPLIRPVIRRRCIPVRPVILRPSARLGFWTRRARAPANRARLGVNDRVAVTRASVRARS